MHLGDVRTAASLFDPACTHGDVSGRTSTVTAAPASVNCARGGPGRSEGPRPPRERRNALLAAGGARAAADLAYDPARAVDVIERLDQGGARDRHRPGLLLVGPGISPQRADVSRGQE